MGVLKARVGGAWVPVSQGFDTSSVGYVGSAIQSSVQSGVIGEVDAAGMTVTWVADPTHRYRTTVFLLFRQGAAAGEQYATITDGSNTHIKGWAQSAIANGVNTAYFAVVETGLSGSTTRKARIAASTAMATNATEYTGWILVEDITAVTPGGSVTEAASFTPTLSGVTLGAGGTNTARYLWTGGPNSGDYGTLYMQGMFQLGTSGGGVNLPNVTVPPQFIHQMPWNVFPVGWCCAGNYMGIMRPSNATTIELRVNVVSGTYETTTTISNTVPEVPPASNPYAWQCLLNAKRA